MNGTQPFGGQAGLDYILLNYHHGLFSTTGFFPINAVLGILQASLVGQLQCGRPRFNPWIGKNLQRREELPTPVFLPGEFHGLWGRRESDMTERLSQFTGIFQQVQITEGDITAETQLLSQQKPQGHSLHKAYVQLECVGHFILWFSTLVYTKMGV